MVAKYLFSTVTFVYVSSLAYRKNDLSALTLVDLSVIQKDVKESS